MNSSCLVLVAGALVAAETHLEEVVAPSLRVDLTSTSDQLPVREVSRLLRLELGAAPTGDRELFIELHDDEAKLTVRGTCEAAELHEAVALRREYGAANARVVALAAAEFVRRDLPPCVREVVKAVEPAPPEAPTPVWLPTLQPFLGARALLTQPTLLPYAGVEFAASSPAQEWWGEFAFFLQGTRVTRDAGLTEVWAPTISLGARHEWGEFWRFGLGVRTEASWAVINGTSAQPQLEGRNASGLLLGSNLTVSLRRFLAGAAWFTAEVSAGYGWRGIDVRLADARIVLLGGFWLDARLGVSFDLVGARP